MNLLSKNLFFIEVDLSQKNDVLKFICKKAEENKVISKKSSDKIFKSFIHRENQSTTGFEDGFAIPHAVSQEIIKPAIIFARLTKGVDWNSLDGKPTKYIIALLIPEEQRSSSHMNVLSSIALGLLNDNFKKVLKNSNDKDEIYNIFENQLNKVNAKPKILSENESYRILAITACPVGIAHTYLAAESIENASKKLNIPVKVSTHGSVGVKNDFTSKEIESAELIIISSDVGINLERFKGKKIYQTNIKSAIQDPIKLIQDGLKNGKIIDGIQSKLDSSTTRNDKKSYIVKHLLSGVSYMIPFIIFGGLLIAIALGLGKAIYDDGNIPKNTFLFYLLKFGETSFGLMIAILGGYIANSIAGRSAIAPAMIVSLIANSTALIFPLPGIESANTPLGFIGAILFGVLIGYTVKWMNSWNIHKNLSSMMPIFIIPLGVTTFYGLLSVFIIGAPISYIMDKFGESMSLIFENNETSNIGIRVGIGIGMGLLLGAMIGFDMGGPINKIAFVVSSALLTQNIKNPMGMIAASIPVAPIAMGLSTIIYKKHFSQEERGLGVSAIMMGSIGISEGAIPFAIKDPKRVFIANILGSAIAGGIAGALGVTGAVAHGGPIVALLGGISSNFIGNTISLQMGLGITFFFLAIVVGVIATILVYGLLIRYIKDDNKEVINKKNGVISTFKIKFNELLKSSPIISKLQTSNKKVIAFSIMSFISASLLIMGIVLISISSHSLLEFIRIVNSSLPLEFVPEFPILSMYGLFGIVLGALLGLATLFYSFTVFKQKQ